MLESYAQPPVPRAYDAGSHYLAQLSDLLQHVSARSLSEAVAVLLAARDRGARVYVFGNGGSAATASHFVCDLTKTAHVAGQRRLRAFALTDNLPLLTAVGNDLAYEHVFAEQLAAHLEPGDVVIAISVSGTSPNVVNAVLAARAGGALTIALTGKDGGAIHALADVSLHIPSYDYGLVEDVHAAIGHALTTAIRDARRPETPLVVQRLLSHD